MNRVLARLAAVACAGAAACSVWAAEPALPAVKADVAKGQKIATQVCAACHGADGTSPAPANPHLAAQIPEYLQRQLISFKGGHKGQERDSPIMKPMAMPLSDDDMRDVAAYYGSQKAKPGVAKSKESVELGRKLYRGGDASRGLPACASCHGATGAGIPALFPRLAGQYPEYAEAQLKAFRSGARANDPNKVMRAIAAKMTDQEISAVSDYVAGLR
jgi:cytochrome c553